VTHEGPVVLFDGVCNLCNAAVQFMIDRDRAGVLRFAPIQSELGKELLEKTMGAEKATSIREGATGNGDPDTLVLVDGDKAFIKSGAALRIARRLTFPWSWLVVGLAVPYPIRDLFYVFVAKNRYRWFGKSDTCRIPTPELRARFLA
jgi:predicted DCC family thiol-disulfide oxidoreductase YuxK